MTWLSRRAKWLLDWEHFVPVLAVLLAAPALVLAISAYSSHSKTEVTQTIVNTVKQEHSAGYGKAGCWYLEAIGAANGAPIRSCVLQAVHVSGDQAVGLFKLSQRFNSKWQTYNLEVGFVRSQWQVTAVKQSNPTK